jgi:hypothetical protein
MAGGAGHRPFGPCRTCRAKDVALQCNNLSGDRPERRIVDNKQALSVLIVSTLAFTVCFMVWMTA